MKLNDDFITQELDGVQLLIPIGGEAFHGIAQSNKAAAFIVDCLKEETTEEAIVAKMCEKYDAPQAVLAADVREILDTLRSIHALEE